jgi:hypothetical protein
MNHLHSSSVRRAVRAVTLVPAVLAVTAATPAFADAPASWEESPSVSPLHFLLVILLIPAGLFVVIAFLAYVPALVKGDAYKPGQAWRSEPEWFGGPTDGLGAADKQDPAAVEAGSDERGGARAQW